MDATMGGSGDTTAVEWPAAVAPDPDACRWEWERNPRGITLRMGFFVPPGTAGRWLGTGIRTAGQGTWIVVPCPGRTAGGVRWLIVADGSGTLNDPPLLELAMHEASAGIARADKDQGGRGR
ncbi:hypothetical protein ACF08N_30285 [Streptomyces sp. NPDC015127]|uniref:hypothetical protein n=1 Tax=Streptomyces sp. NPDC015127 TaxID=3364939 RepID=UPI003701D649